MLDLFPDNPGRLFAVATLLPLLPVVGILIASTVRNLVRPVGRRDGPASSVYWLLGGDHPLKTGGYAALAAMLLAAVLAITGLAKYLEDVEAHEVAPPDPSQELPARHEAVGHHDAHPADHAHGPVFTRRGRFGRFFLYLSLFAFSMLNLLVADNLLQVFVGWELVGVCSFF